MPPMTKEEKEQERRARQAEREARRIERGGRLPRWVRWLGRSIVGVVVDLFDTDGDGEIEPSEVLTVIIEEVVQPALDAHPRVRTDG